MKLILIAILWLAPHLEHQYAEGIAKIIHWETTFRKISPMLVVAIIWRESGFKLLEKSKTNDYGLMQIHVSKTCFRKYIGKEHQLYDPHTNLYEGVKLLSMFKHWHMKHCIDPFTGKEDHPWWSHYKWGFRKPRDQRWSRVRVGKLYKRLVERYGFKERMRVSSIEGENR